ncbi:MAG: RND family efflux transporter MFP subunit [Gammaproteobacteria bacterium]|jgi:RND family efflux transporter MFP subunit
MFIQILILAASLLPNLAIAQQAAPLTTPLATVAAQTVTSLRFYPLDGAVEASQQTVLSAQISGRVEQIYFDIGNQVEQGAVLVRVRDIEYAARLDQAKAQLAAASAGLKQSQQEIERRQGMFNEKLLSAAIFDKARADLQASKARAAASRASVAELQQQLSNTVVRAPYSGVVIARYIEPGETIGVGQKLMAGYARDSLRVLVQLPRSMFAAVREQRIGRSGWVVAIIGASGTTTFIPVFKLTTDDGCDGYPDGDLSAFSNKPDQRHFHRWCCCHWEFITVARRR